VAGWFLSFFPLLGQAISFRCGPPAHPPTYEANWMDEREAHPPPTSPTDRSMYISLDLGNRRRRRRRRSTAASGDALVRFSSDPSITLFAVGKLLALHPHASPLQLMCLRIPTLGRAVLPSPLPAVRSRCYWASYAS
jgi:hypothetical protein